MKCEDLGGREEERAGVAIGEALVLGIEKNGARGAGRQSLFTSKLILH